MNPRTALCAVLTVTAFATVAQATEELPWQLPVPMAAVHGLPANLVSGARPLPAAMEQGLAPELLRAAGDQADLFVDSLLSAGGGDGDGQYRGDGPGAGAIAALAFILGVIPGFGIGHLVAGSIGGFVSWLVVDVVIGVLLFWVLPYFLFPVFPFIWTVSVIAVIIERFVEGYSAFRSARYYGGLAMKGDSDRPELADGTAPRKMAHNLMSLSF